MRDLRLRFILGRPHAAHTPFVVRRRLVLSLILPNVNYGNIVFTGADSASQRRLEVAFKAGLRCIFVDFTDFV
jgi:hypothetical protein